MKKNRFYLYERNYITGGFRTPSTEHSEMAEFWNIAMGKEFFRHIYDNLPEVRACMSGEAFKAAVPDCNQTYSNKPHNTDSRPDNDDKAVNDSARCAVVQFLRQHEDSSFSWFYEDELTQALRFVWADSAVINICTDQVWTDYLDITLSKLETVAVRTLISEIRTYKTEGKLKGSNEKEEYNYFIDTYVKDHSWKEDIYIKYPVLKRCIEEVVCKTAALISEALHALRSDKQEIIKEICRGKKFTKVTKLHGNLSDTHRGGKSVLKLDLSNRITIIYKPHSLDNEAVFYTLAGQMAGKCGTDIHALHIIRREGYGWSECISYKRCEDRSQLDRYYYRMGIYVFLAYILGTHDIHCENVIAHGEYPVVIDLENILGYQDQETCDSLEQTIKSKISTSVLYSGILPYYQWQEAGGVVHSAIGTKVNREYSFKVPVVCESGTSNIQVEYKSPAPAEAQNTAMLKDGFVDPVEFTDSIKLGFETAYKWSISNKQILKSWIRPLEEITGRCLTADTQRYAMLLNSSYHSLLMDDGAARQIYMYTLYYGRDIQSPVDRSIVDSEIRDLLNHDIPYFYMEASGTSLYDSRDKELPGYFKTPPIDKVYERVERLGQQDLGMQSEFIQASMELKDEKSGKLINKYIFPKMKKEWAGKVSKGRLLSYSEGIAGYLMDHAVYDKEGNIGWYSIHVKSSGSYGWDIRPLDMYLYDGTGGIAVFFRMLAQATGKEQYHDVCANLEKQLFQYTDKVITGQRKNMSPNTGAYNGEASIILTYLLLYEITGQEIYLENAERHSEIVDLLLPKDRNYDLLDGIAGAACIYCRLYKASNDPRYLARAEQAGRRLIAEAVVKDPEEGACWRGHMDTAPLLGLSHGNAGIMLAFETLYCSTGKDVYLHWLKKALRYEDARYDNTIHNWLDMRTAPDQRADSQADAVAWCHGAGGILLSRLKLLEITKPGSGLDKMIRRDISAATAKLKEKKMREGMCLCHGLSGNLLILDEYARHMQDTAIEKECREGLGYVLERISKDKDNILPQEHYNPGLMSGYTGIGYFLLKMYDSGFPDILMV